MTHTLPTVPLGPHQITRLIVGGNPFCGNSHYSQAMSQEMRDYYSAEQVVDVLAQCQAAGINTVQARGDYHRILYWIELFRRQGGELHWIAQTASEMHDVFQNIHVLAAAGAMGIYHHGTRTDHYWHEGQIDRVQDYLKCMRDTGVQVGLGTHIPEVIVYAKAALFFDALAREVGAETYQAIMRQYLEQYRWKIANPEGFLQVAESVSGQDLYPLYNHWILGTQ